MYYYYDGPIDTPTQISRDEILDKFWNLWREKMIKKYGENSELITKDNCIQDWCVTHWAWQ